MSTHDIYFRREIRKILCGYPLLSAAMLINLLSVYLQVFVQITFTSDSLVDGITM